MLGKRERNAINNGRVARRSQSSRSSRGAVDRVSLLGLTFHLLVTSCYLLGKLLMSITRTYRVLFLNNTDFFKLKTNDKRSERGVLAGQFLGEADIPCH